MTLMGSPVSLASCSLMWRVGLGVCEKAFLRISNCLALMVVRGPRRLEPAPPSSGDFDSDGLSLRLSPSPSPSTEPSKSPNTFFFGCCFFFNLSWFNRIYHTCLRKFIVLDHRRVNLTKLWSFDILEPLQSKFYFLFVIQLILLTKRVKSIHLLFNRICHTWLHDFIVFGTWSCEAYKTLKLWYFRAFIIKVIFLVRYPVDATYLLQIVFSTLWFCLIDFHWTNSTGSGRIT